MDRGEPLTDADRSDWLKSLGTHPFANSKQPGSQHLVITCSALKRSYRDALRDGCRQVGDKKIRFIFLDAPEPVIFDRVTERHGHFARSNLVRSQFEILERPSITESDVLMVPANASLDEVQKEVLKSARQLTC